MKTRRLTFDVDDVSNVKSESQSSASQKTTNQRISRSSTSSKNKANIDTARFDYKIFKDDDSVAQYHKYPKSNSNMHVYEISRLTKVKKPRNFEWKDLPSDVQREWLEQRKLIADQYRNPIVQTAMNDSRVLNDSLRNGSSFESNEAAGAYALRETPYRKISKKSASARKSTKKKIKKKGSGMKNDKELLNFNFIPYNVNNKIVYEYFDNPNELCDRLRLLVSSKLAGNSNHMQEISSIVEELRELKYIS